MAVGLLLVAPRCGFEIRVRKCLGLNDFLNCSLNFRDYTKLKHKLRIVS